MLSTEGCIKGRFNGRKLSDSKNFHKLNKLKK